MTRCAKERKGELFECEGDQYFTHTGFLDNVLDIDIDVDIDMDNPLYIDIDIDIDMDNSLDIDIDMPTVH